MTQEDIIGLSGPIMNKKKMFALADKYQVIDEDLPGSYRLNGFGRKDIFLPFSHFNFSTIPRTIRSELILMVRKED